MAQVQAQTYTLTFQNNSSNLGNACVYQTSPDINNPQIMSLAWFSQKAYPTTQVQFQWTIDYCFVWDETGPLVPGVVFDASQQWPANLTSANSVVFNYQNGAYTFSNQQKAPISGSLFINQGSNIPVNTSAHASPPAASVGIGMSGAGTFVQQAQPNLNLSFTPHPVYWITFGDYQTGQVLDIETITNAQQITFSPNVYNVGVTLNLDNTWSID